MIGHASMSASPWRFNLGLGCFIAAFAIHLATLAAIVAGANAATVGAIAALNFALNKALLLIAVAIMGKPGFYRLKQLVFGAFRRYAPPHEVGPLRYRIGLVLFATPIFLGWVSPYLQDITPTLSRHSIRAAIFGDAMLLIGLFVLGGSFWDKLHALFVREAQVSSGLEP